MGLSLDERFNILTIELQLLQTRLIKFDDLVWSSRSWAITLVVAIIGWAVAQDQESTIDHPLLSVAVIVALLFWFEEALLRYFYLYKYVVRYRRLRIALNDEKSSLNKLPIYDLTNHIEGRDTRRARLAFTLSRPEQVVFYLVLIAIPIIVACTAT